MLGVFRLQVIWFMELKNEFFFLFEYRLKVLLKVKRKIENEYEYGVIKRTSKLKKIWSSPKSM